MHARQAVAMNLVIIPYQLSQPHTTMQQADDLMISLLAVIPPNEPSLRWWLAYSSRVCQGLELCGGSLVATRPNTHEWSLTSQP